MAMMAKDAALAEPTRFHMLLGDLYKRGTLGRVYTQNIDGLELRVGLTCEGDDASCIQLHGTLMELSCTACSSTQLMYHHFHTLKGGTFPPCPECQLRADGRQNKRRRAISTGILRPKVILYDETHPQGEEIAKVQSLDLEILDFFLVAGTSLQTYGSLGLIKKFSAGLHLRNSRNVLYINKTRPPKSYESIFDTFIQADCQDFASYVYQSLGSNPQFSATKQFRVEDLEEWDAHTKLRQDFRPSWNWA